MPSLSFHPEIMLPAEYIPWLLAQPDAVMDLHEVIQASLSFGLASPHDAVLENPFHDAVVKKQLTRNLHAITPDIVDELSTAIDELWDMDPDEWREVCVWDTMQAIVGRTSNRVFVGLPLCRDEDFLHHVRAFAVAMVNQIGIVKFLLPAVLAPLLGPLFALVCKYRDWKVAKLLMPTIEVRLEQAREIRRAEMERRPTKAERVPNDLLQWLVDYAVDKGSAHDQNPRYLSSRITILNFAALHTSTISITNTLLDLLAAPNGQQWFQEIRAEAESVFAAHDNSWTKTAASRLVKTDSTLRETLRFTGLGGRSLVREVVANDGVTLPNGLHLPQGARVGVAASRIHRDEQYYSEPDVYDPFRFSKLRDELPPLKGLALSTVTTSPEFLTFGHGRRACPGRFFAAHELKLLIAMLATRYDIKPIEERPANTWISDMSVPPRTATIWIKRRKATKRD